MFRRLIFCFSGFLACLPGIASAQESDGYHTRADQSLVGPPIFYSGYFWDSDSDIDGGGTLSADTYLLRVPLFILGRGKEFFLTGSTKYEYSQFTFNDFDLLPDLNTHAIRARLTGYWEPNNGNPWFAQFRYEPGIYMQDGTGVDADDYQSRVFAALGYRWSPTLRFVLAGIYTESYADASVIPGLGLIWEPNDDWDFHLAPPEPKITYYPTEDWALHLKLSSGGGSWDLDAQSSTEIDQLIYRQFRLGLGIERRIYKNFWAALWGGSNLYQNIELQDSREIVHFEEDLDSSWYVYAGFHLAAW